MSHWSLLKRFTSARVALGRTGSSLPTSAQLEFELAHAKARDAVRASFNTKKIAAEVEALGWPCLRVHSAAADRNEYLRRPDLGRRLRPGQTEIQPIAPPPELVFVIADGLSAWAAERHAIPLLVALRKNFEAWRIGPIIVAEQARVALGDEIGEILGAHIVVMLIGERPGLSSPDSLGIYLTWDPRIGRTDAERNCISNVRPTGLSYELAAHRLVYLLESARRVQLTGVKLKDASGELPLGTILAP
jgi:ethanolamine ammonia-lyase small subunit